MRRVVNVIEPHDATRCPLGEACAFCSAAADDLAVTTWSLFAGVVICLTLCGPCAERTEQSACVFVPASLAPAVELWSLRDVIRMHNAHARHLGLTSAQLAALERERRDAARSPAG